MRAIVIVTLAGCSIGPVSIEGKDCPCPSGYTCVMNRCTQAAETIDARIPDAPQMDAPGAMIFDDEFNASIIGSAWDLNTGSWAEVGGMLDETNGTGGTQIWVSGYETQTDYTVVVAAAAQTSAPVSDDALEIAVRVGSDLNHTHYQCSWEPGDKTLRIFDVPRTHTNDLDGSPSQQALDPFGTYVMHTVVTGPTIHCWVEGIATADLTLQLTATQVTAGLGMGTFGLGTYNQPVAFDYIRVTR